jgi:hypothetical protein
MAACEMTDSCDPATDPNCVPNETGTDAGGDTAADTPQFQTYHYILIEDLDNEASGPRPGADIDGVELLHGGTRSYLAEIEESRNGGEVAPGANADFNNAIGQPEGQCVGRDDSEWDLETFVSLGGEGGYLLAYFDDLAPIENGDTITVTASSDTASNEWQLRVGVGTSATDPDFFLLGTGVGVREFDVQGLPLVEQN